MKKDGSDSITIADKFEFGLFSIDELARLKHSSKSTIYSDISAGRLPIVKCGRLTRIAGPVARDYLPGRQSKHESEVAE